MADKHIDDLEPRLVDPATEVIEKHLLGHNGALAQAEQLEYGVLFASQRQLMVVDRDNPGVEMTVGLPVRIIKLKSPPERQTVP